MDHYTEETVGLIGFVPKQLYIHYRLQEAKRSFCPFEEKLEPHPGFNPSC